MANYKSSYGNIYDRCTKKSFSYVRGKPRNGQLAQLGSFHQSWPKVMRMGSTISQSPPPPPTHSHLPPVIWLRKSAILPGYSRFQMSEKPKQTGRKAEKRPKTESKYYSCCEQRKDMLNLNKF